MLSLKSSLSQIFTQTNQVMNFSKKFVDYGLYLVTDSKMAKKSLEDLIFESIEGGVSCVQLRDPMLSYQETINLAKKIKRRMSTEPLYGGVPLLINNDVEVAVASNADGVHVGTNDLSPQQARSIIGDSKILGVTISSEGGNRKPIRQQIYEAIVEGKADYLGTDAIFKTDTKKYEDRTKKGENFTNIGIDYLKDEIINNELIKQTKIPIIGIGGINSSNADQVFKEGQVDGIAVVSAICNKDDVKSASKQLRNIVNKNHKYRTEEESNLIEKSIECFQNVKFLKPLVHHITNYVAMNLNANATLFCGGSPLMAHAFQEVKDLVQISSSLVINPGTLDNDWIKGMKLAMNEASILNKPIIFDPVGMGASNYRNETFKNFLDNYKISILKGNSGEIGTLFGDKNIETKGVDCEKGVDNPEFVVKELSKIYNKKKFNQFDNNNDKRKMISAITGEIDYVSDGEKVVKILNNDKRMANFTASGCTVSSLMGCFAGANPDNLFESAVGALLFSSVSGELSSFLNSQREMEKIGTRGFGMIDFYHQLLNVFSLLSPTLLRKLAKIEIVN